MPVDVIASFLRQAAFVLLAVALTACGSSSNPVSMADAGSDQRIARTDSWCLAIRQRISTNVQTIMRRNSSGQSAGMIRTSALTGRWQRVRGRS